MGIPNAAKDALHMGIESVEEISKKTFPKVIKRVFDKMERFIDRMNASLG